MRVLGQKDRQTKDTILLLDGDGAGEDDSALGTVRNHNADLVDQEAHRRRQPLSPDLGRASPGAISVQLTQPITYARNSRLPLIL